jgi:hypothetical protein
LIGSDSLAFTTDGFVVSSHFPKSSAPKKKVSKLVDTIRSLRRVHFALLPWKRFRFSVPETTSNCLNFGHAKDDEGWPAALVKRERSCITDHRRPAHTSALSVSKKTRVSELCPVASTSIVSPRRLYSIRNTDSRTPAACDFVLFFCFVFLFPLYILTLGRYIFLSSSFFL